MVELAVYAVSRRMQFSYVLNLCVSAEAAKGPPSHLCVSTCLDGDRRKSDFPAAYACITQRWCRARTMYQRVRNYWRMNKMTSERRCLAACVASRLYSTYLKRVGFETRAGVYIALTLGIPVFESMFGLGQPVST